MAEPTYTGTVGRGLQVGIREKRSSNGIDDLTVYSYQNFLELRDTAGNVIHIILGTGVPSDVATYDNAPLASIYINYAGGDGTCMYLKEAAGASGWAPVTTGAQA